jgi:hypothetical protein
VAKSSKTVYASDETRGKKRFGFEVPLPATFASLPVDLLDISVVGAQIRHNDAVAIGKEAPLAVTLPGTQVTLTIRSRVHWSRLSGRGPDGASFYRTGLIFNEARTDVTADLVDQLVQTKYARFDPESLEKKREAAARREESRLKLKKEAWQQASSAAEQIDRVRKARIYLRNNPVESNKWHNRARYVASRQRDNAYTIEELAVWEYLGRNVDLSVVDLAFKLG